MGRWIYALRIFGDMPSHGCTPDLYTCGTLIHALCGFGMIGESKERYSNKWRQKFVCLVRHIIMSWYVCVQKVLDLYSFLEFCFINLRIVNCFVDLNNLYFQRLLIGKLTLGCIIYMCSKGISSV